jgi:hypothetical protein
MNERQSNCEICGAAATQHYQLFRFGQPSAPSEETVRCLCVGCARKERQRLQTATAPPGGLTRAELIAKLDRFFAASGVFDICRRCHEQGTGCCPPTCRILSAHGCDPANGHGKTLFCATFICSALLNAINECEPEIGRVLKWLKRDVGATEWRVYQMYTRVPQTERDPERPLALPPTYPDPGELDGAQLKARLSALADEVLEVRRRWYEQEQRECA